MRGVFGRLRTVRPTALIMYTLVAALVVVLGVRVWQHTHKPAPPAHKAAKHAAVTHTTNKPSESKTEAAAYKWQGEAADPKRLQIPSIGVDTFIQRMDVDQNNEIAAPNNIHLAGWYVRSVRPGDLGLSIIDGHLNGLTSKAGVFGSLDKVQVGDAITVVRGDDKTATYHVTSVQNVPVADVPDVLYSQDPANAKGQLNLITCSGKYDYDAERYDHRTVVTAAL